MNTKSARALRKNLTEAEQCLWQQLKRRQIATVNRLPPDAHVSVSCYLGKMRS